MNSRDFTLSMLVMNGICWREQPIPEEEHYDGYIQLENGVGMLRLLKDEVAEELVRSEKGDDQSPSCFDCDRKSWRHRCWKNIMQTNSVKNIRMYRRRSVTIINYFFGESITVSGLITGQDLIGAAEREEILATACCFRATCSVREKTSFWTM